jgi:hypothetical protein
MSLVDDYHDLANEAAYDPETDEEGETGAETEVSWNARAAYFGRCFYLLPEPSAHYLRQDVLCVDWPRLYCELDPTGTITLYCRRGYAVVPYERGLSLLRGLLG